MGAGRSLLHLRNLLCVSALATLSPGRADASCQMAAQLAKLHTAYADVIEGQGTPREDIGRFVIERDLGGTSGAGFRENLRSSGFYDQIDVIAPMLDDMERLASDSLSQATADRHLGNLEQLSSTLRGTGCFEAPVTEANAASTGPEKAADPDGADESQSAGFVSPSMVKRLTQLVQDEAPISYGVLALAMAALVMAGIFVRRMIRSARARAFPRVPFGGRLPITNAAGSTTPLLVVDISQGGIAVQRPKGAPPDAFDRIDIGLPSGQHPMRLRWENEHFFGYEFDAPLDEEALQAVLDLDIERETTVMQTTRENESGAPEDAAETPT